MTKVAKFSSNNYIANVMGIPSHDFMENTWTDGKLTKVTYRSGGADGNIVAVIEYTYSGDNLLTVRRTT